MLKYLPNVVTLRLDTEKCTGCGVCTMVCPHGVFRLEGRKAEIVDLDACIECGACAGNCAFGAIRVTTGTGCAAGILMGAIGKGGECCGPSGVSPASGQSCCDGSSGIAPAVDEPVKENSRCNSDPFPMIERKTSCCGPKSTQVRDDEKPSCCG